MTGLKFEDQVFFHAVLPIIIFCAGYGLDVKTFFLNFRSILLIGLVGTVTLWLGLSYTAMFMVEEGYARNLTNMDCLVLGAVIASTDTVAVVALLDPEAVPTLYCILAGEGMANDGIAVVLYRAVTNIAENLLEYGGPDEDKSVSWHLMGELMVEFVYVLSLSVVLGVATGFASAFCAKWNRIRPPHDIETILIFIWGFVSYFLAEMFDCSGIISIFVCGIIQSQYTVLNISPTAQFSSFHALNTLAYSMEALIFTVLGFYMWSYIGDDFSFTDVDGAWKDVQLSAAMFAALFVCRIILVFALVGLGNYGKTGLRKLKMNEYYGIIYAGLIRGVIAFALSQSIKSRAKENKDGMVTTTYVMVMTTTVLGGCLSKPFFKCIGIPTGDHGGGGGDFIDIPLPEGDDPLGASASGFPMATMTSIPRRTLSHHRYSARYPATTFERTFTGADLNKTYGGVGSTSKGVMRRQMSRIHTLILEEANEEPESCIDHARVTALSWLKKFDDVVLQPLFGLTEEEREKLRAQMESSPLLSKQGEDMPTFPQVVHGSPPGENPFRPH
eukprot:TRINITY_DN19288_c0_g1_i1.p1 TRINITY_DN19288_c0_g1~~TRINITY_DN19288_c0_g1_i1.p1  ORF type:complete len:617 (+),score=97.03 TRINITY_DN19288_c0_g1_i1:183-1853(+)